MLGVQSWFDCRIRYSNSTVWASQLTYCIVIWLWIDIACLAHSFSFCFLFLFSCLSLFSWINLYMLCQNWLVYLSISSSRSIGDSIFFLKLHRLYMHLNLLLFHFKDKLCFFFLIFLSIFRNFLTFEHTGIFFLCNQMICWYWSIHDIYVLLAKIVSIIQHCWIIHLNIRNFLTLIAFISTSKIAGELMDSWLQDLILMCEHATSVSHSSPSIFYLTINCVHQILF